jgi:tRNA G18 (ribose-2'-O)-methylase SpoU
LSGASADIVRTEGDRHLHVETADDPRVAEYSAVPDAQLLRTRGLFVAEGRLVVQRLVEDGRYRIRSLLLSEAAHAALSSTVERLSRDVPVLVCRAEAFSSITGYNIHRGCLALVERPPAARVDEVLSGAQTVVVLEAVTNADNVGGVFRNAAAFGAEAVLLSPTCCDPLYRKAIRTSMGATLRVPFSRLEPWPGAIATLRRHGFAVVALTPREPARTIDAMASAGRPERIALLLGTEGAGLSAAAESAADQRVRIPIGPEVDSLNLAVAAGIALSRLSRLTNSGNSHT